MNIYDNPSDSSQLACRGASVGLKNPALGQHALGVLNATAYPGLPEIMSPPSADVAPRNMLDAESAHSEGS